MQCPEDQLEATENGPTHVNCGLQRIDADQRGFCAVPDSGRAVLAIDPHEPASAQPPPAHAVEHALVWSIGARVIR